MLQLLGEALTGQQGVLILESPEENYKILAILELAPNGGKCLTQRELFADDESELLGEWRYRSSVESG